MWFNWISTNELYSFVSPFVLLGHSSHKFMRHKREYAHIQRLVFSYGRFNAKTINENSNKEISIFIRYDSHGCLMRCQCWQWSVLLLLPSRCFLLLRKSEKQWALARRLFITNSDRANVSHFDSAQRLPRQPLLMPNGSERAPTSNLTILAILAHLLFNDFSLFAYVVQRCCACI